MKNSVFILFVALSGAFANTSKTDVSSSNNSPSASATANSSGDWLKQIVTVEGTVYNNCRLLKIEPNGLLVEHAPQPGALGLAKIKFSSLTTDLQKKFNYNPAEAEKFDELQAKANADWSHQLIQLEQKNQEFNQEEQREAYAVRSAEEAVRLTNERQAEDRAHEIQAIREQAYGQKEANRWLPNNNWHWGHHR